MIAALADCWRDREDGDSPSEPLGLRVRSVPEDVVVEACEDLLRNRNGVSVEDTGDESRENREGVNDAFITIL